MNRELTSQELLDRYVESVKTMLPPDKMCDIAAEIRSNLESLVEDQAAQQGRELSTDEVSAILKQYGHPVLLANRYHDEPRRGLISPQLFPFYWFTMCGTLGLIFTILAIIAVFKVQGQPDPTAFLLHFGRDILRALFYIAAIITVVFATWDYLEFRYRFSERWKPESLPPVAPPIRQPKRPSPAVQIAGGIAWIVIWFGTLYVPAFSWIWGAWAWGGLGVFGLSPAGDAMRLPLFLLVLVGIPQLWLDHTRFAAAEWRRILRIGLSLTAIVIAIFLLRHGDFLVAGPNWNPAQGQTLTTLNHMIAGSLVLACAFSGLLCVHELRHWVRNSNARNSNAASHAPLV